MASDSGQKGRFQHARSLRWLWRAYLARQQAGGKVLREALDRAASSQQRGGDRGVHVVICANVNATSVLGAGECGPGNHAALTSTAGTEPTRATLATAITAAAAAAAALTRLSAISTRWHNVTCATLECTYSWTTKTAEASGEVKMCRQGEFDATRSRQAHTPSGGSTLVPVPTRPAMTTRRLALWPLGRLNPWPPHRVWSMRGMPKRATTGEGRRGLARSAGAFGLATQTALVAQAAMVIVWWLPVGLCVR